MTYDHITYEQKQFLLWLGRKPNPHRFEYDDWKDYYSELIDALYARFKGWDKRDFKYETVWPDFIDELSNSPRS